MTATAILLLKISVVLLTVSLLLCAWSYDRDAKISRAHSLSELATAPRIEYYIDGVLFSSQSCAVGHYTYNAVLSTEYTDGVLRIYTNTMPERTGP